MEHRSSGYRPSSHAALAAWRVPLVVARFEPGVAGASSSPCSCLDRAGSLPGNATKRSYHDHIVERLRGYGHLCRSSRKAGVGDPRGRAARKIRALRCRASMASLRAPSARGAQPVRRRCKRSQGGLYPRGMTGHLLRLGSPVAGGYRASGRSPSPAAGIPASLLKGDRDARDVRCGRSPLPDHPRLQKCVPLERVGDTVFSESPSPPAALVEK